MNFLVRAVRDADGASLDERHVGVYLPGPLVLRPLIFYTVPEKHFLLLNLIATESGLKVVQMTSPPPRSSSKKRKLTEAC
jgi:hypothetical protein